MCVTRRGRLCIRFEEVGSHIIPRVFLAKDRVEVGYVSWLGDGCVRLNNRTLLIMRKKYKEEKR
jgi:hypothetical protein